MSGCPPHDFSIAREMSSNVAHTEKSAGQVLVLPDLTVLGSIAKASELAGVPVDPSDPQLYNNKENATKSYTFREILSDRSVLALPHLTSFQSLIEAARRRKLCTGLQSYGSDGRNTATSRSPTSVVPAKERHPVLRYGPVSSLPSRQSELRDDDLVSPFRCIASTWEVAQHAARPN